MGKDNRFKVEKDILKYIMPIINEYYNFYSDINFYNILSTTDLIYLYDNTYPGYEIIPQIKDTQQYCFMSLFGHPTTISELKEFKLTKEDGIDYNMEFQLDFQSTVKERIKDEGAILFEDDLIELYVIRDIVISRTLKELNRTLV